MNSYFTEQTANEVLPLVIKKFDELKKKKQHVGKVEQMLNMTMSPSSTLGEYSEIKRQLNSAMTEFYKCVEELESTGVVIKGIDQGLLDFPSKRFDEDVWLCWKEGETEIKFWHEKDVGFTGRKPLEVSDDSLV